YPIRDDRGLAPRDVVVENELGSQPFVLGDADRLCLPSQTQETPSALAIDDFTCSRAQLRSGTRFPVRTVHLADAFRRGRFLVGRPRLFCVPAGTAGAAIADPSTQLTCYALTANLPRRAASARLVVGDDLGQRTLHVLKAPHRMLCIPSVAPSTTSTTTSSTTTSLPTTSTSTSTSTTTTSSTSTSSTTPSSATSAISTANINTAATRTTTATS